MFNGNFQPQLSTVIKMSRSQARPSNRELFACATRM